MWKRAVLLNVVRPTIACYHRMLFKELAAERGFLKMVSANKETR
jgi:hypothetical protein